MPLHDLLSAGLTPQLAQDAVRLLVRVINSLDFVADNGAEVLFALRAGPELYEALSTFGAATENDEDDSLAERDGRELAPLLAALLAPVPRAGHAVPAWSPPVEPLPRVPLRRPPSENATHVARGLLARALREPREVSSAERGFLPVVATG